MHEALTVLGEDADVLAIAKPAGLPVFPPHADADGDCVLARLLVARPTQRRGDWPSGFAGGIAHRLDIPTSGQLLVARDPAALARLRARFAARALHKTYRLVTARDVPWDEHVVDRRLAHDPRRKARMVVERGRATPHRGRWHDAETRFVRRGPVGPGWTAWTATMRTGVMHQIRAHAAACGLALVGDRLYGGGDLDPDVPPGRPEAARFLLHHVGLVGDDDWRPARAPVPSWWPE